MQVGDLVQHKITDLLGLVVAFDPAMGGHDPHVRVKWLNGKHGWCWLENLELVEMVSAKRT